MPGISVSKICVPFGGGGIDWSSYWTTQGVTPGADATLITEAINEALQNFSHVKITEAGIYEVDDTIWIPSNRTLEFVAGCTLKKKAASTFSHVIANEGMLTRTADTNINIIGNGLVIDINGIDGSQVVVIGVRGHISMFQVSNFLISGIETTTIEEQQFFIHLAEVSDFILRDIDAEGWKDGIHLGVASNFLMEDIRTCTIDDGIALNAGDYRKSNPTVGNITNGIIRRWTDADQVGQGGSGCLLLSRSWENWTDGHDYQLNDYVNNAGNVYQKTSAGTQTAATAPVHSSGIVTGADGITWAWIQAGTINHADVTGVTFEDCVWASRRSFIRTSGSAVSDPMRSFYPGTGAQSIVDNIVIENLTATPSATGLSIVLADVNMGTVEFKNMSLALASSYLFRIVPREETFVIDKIIFNNSVIDIEGDKRLVIMPAVEYDYKVNNISIVSGSDIRTDDVNRASLIAYPATGVVGEVYLEDSEFHHLSNIILINNCDGAVIPITAHGCRFDETCERLIWVSAGGINAAVTFNAIDCYFERTSSPMFDNQAASSEITVESTGSLGQTIPNLYVGNVDLSASDLFGANMISNGEFTSGTGWTANTGWTIDGGVAAYDDVTDNTILSQANATMLAPITSGRNYTLTFTVGIATGNARIQIINAGGTAQFVAVAYYANGVHNLNFTPASSNGGLGIRAFTLSSGPFTIDNVVLREV